MLGRCEEKAWTHFPPPLCSIFIGLGFHHFLYSSLSPSTSFCSSSSDTSYLHFFSSISYIFSLLFPQKPSLLSFLHEPHAHHSFKFISSLPPFCPLGHCLDQALMLSASATHMILPASPPCFPSTLHPVIRHISSHCLPIKTLILLGSDRNSSHLAPVYLLPSPCHSSIHFIGLVPFWTL